MFCGRNEQSMWKLVRRIHVAIIRKTKRKKLDANMLRYFGKEVRIVCGTRMVLWGNFISATFFLCILSATLWKMMCSSLSAFGKLVLENEVCNTITSQWARPIVNIYLVWSAGYFFAICILWKLKKDCNLLCKTNTKSFIVKYIGYWLYIFSNEMCNIYCFYIIISYNCFLTNHLHGYVRVL